MDRTGPVGRPPKGTLLAACAVLGFLLATLPVGAWAYAAPTPSAALQGVTEPAVPTVPQAGGTVTTTLQTIQNFSPAKTLSPLFYGVNIRADSAFTAADALALVDAQTLTWRYPGGALAESFNYTTSTNATSGRSETNNLTNFLTLCQSVGCHAILQLPAEIDSPATDAYYVSYVEQTLNFTPSIWEFGNEPSLWAEFGRPWANWTQPGGVNATPSTYAAIVPSIVSAIRSVDPATPLDPLGGVGGNASFDASWVYAVMEAAQTSVQYISIHSYPNGVARTNDSTFYRPLYSAANTLNVLIPDLDNEILAACPNCTQVSILISEVGASPGQINSNFESQFPMVMWDATQIGQAALTNVTSMDFFAFQNRYPGSFMVTAGTFDPAYFLFKDIVPHLGSTVLSLHATHTDNGMFRATAWWSPGDNWTLLLVNLDTRATDDVTIAGSGFPVHGAIENASWNGTTFEPRGGAVTWMNSTTVPPNSLEVITSSPLVPTTKPAAPTGLFASAYNGTRVDVSYVQPAGPLVNDTIAYGWVTRSAPYCNVTGVQSTFGASAGYQIKGLSYVLSYCFAAEAWTSAGAGPWSSFVNVSTNYPPPTNLTITHVGVSTVDLNWVRSVGSGDITVHQALGTASDGCGNFTTLYPLGNAFSYTVTDLTSTGTYCFEVTQSYKIGKNYTASAPSNVVEASTLPVAPGNLTATAISEQSILLAWTNPPGNLIGDAVLWEPGDSCNAPTERNLSGVMDNYTMTGLSSGSQYCFYVEALGTGGPSKGAAPVTAVTDQVPGAPSDVHESLSSTSSITINWSNPPGGGIVNDTIFYGNSSTNLSNEVSTGGASSTFTVNGLRSASYLFFRVQAWNVTGGSSVSGFVEGWTLPQAPTALTVVTVSSTTIGLGWTNPGGNLTDDLLFWKAGASCVGGTQIDLGTTEEQATLTVSSATSYCFYVEAVSAGGPSAPSTWMNATSLPAAPTGLTVVGATTSSITLTWTNPTGTVTDDLVYWAPGSACVDANETNLRSVQTQYTLPELSADTTYCIYVVAESASGPSNQSANLTASTAAFPAPPSGLSTVRVSSASVTLAWTNPPDEDLVNNTIYWGPTCGGYRFEVSTQVPVTGFTVAGLGSNQSNCFAVQAWDGLGPSSLSSGTWGNTTAPVAYAVLVTESGLPDGTPWWFNTSAGTSFSTTTHGLSFVLTNGTYNYTVGTTDKTLWAVAGSIPVDGRSASVDLAFGPYRYGILFVESGLPTGDYWSVHVGSTATVSQTNSVSVEVLNGSYGYTIPGAEGYTANVSGGVVQVDGGTQTILVSFTPASAGYSFLGIGIDGWTIIALELAVLAVVAAIIVPRWRRNRAERRAPPSEGGPEP